jgi:hypothetical protein
MRPITSSSLPLASRLGVEAALGLANSTHGPSAHYGRHARAGEPAHDHLTTAPDARAFLATHAIPVPETAPSAGQLERLRRTRALIRALDDRPGPDMVAWRAALETALRETRFRLDADGTLRSLAEGWDGIADDLLPAALALAAERERIRTCGNPGCRWLFVDRSPKGNRVWCEAAVCGNRMRVGRHRLRREAGNAPDASVSRPGRRAGPRGRP